MRSALLLALLSIPSCTSPGVRATEAPIIDGTPSDQAATVFLIRDHATSPLSCTGFLIAPDLVLTARHCVAPVSGTSRCDDMGALASDPFTDATFAVFTETTPSAASTPLAVTSVSVEPASTGGVMCGRDLGLVRLALPLVGATPLPLRLDAAPVIGEPLTVVGYGYATPGDDTTLYTRRARSDAMLTTVGPSLLGDVVRFTADEFSLDVGPCAGDSGGPAIDAEGRAIGVMSRGSQATCHDMVYERVDAHAPWLREEILASYERAGEAPPAWISGDAGTPDAGAVDAGLETIDAGAAPVSGGCSVGRAAHASLAGLALALLTLVARWRAR